ALLRRGDERLLDRPVGHGRGPFIAREEAPSAAGHLFRGLREGASLPGGRGGGAERSTSGVRIVRGATPCGYTRGRLFRLVDSPARLLSPSSGLLLGLALRLRRRR